MSSLRPIAGLKALLFAACLVPLSLLTWAAFHHGLGANPVEAIEHDTGVWTLRLLLITLCITPLRRLTGWNWLARLRRMLGVYAFFYGCLHFSTYVVFDHFFDLHAIVKDVVKRPYITFGFAALLMLVPLAVTSTNAMVKRLGGARWLRLHAMIYPVAALGVIHYLWLVKADLRHPLIYALMLAVLLGYRLLNGLVAPFGAGAPASRRAGRIA